MKFEEIIKTPSVLLADNDRQKYYDNGYLVFPSLIKTDQLEVLREATDRIVEKCRTLTASTKEIDLEKGHTYDNPRLRRAAYIDDFDPRFWDICVNSPIPDIAVDLLGPNIRFREVMLNFKWAGGGAEVKWHQDIVFYPHTHSGTQQFLLFLEDVTSEQGPLEIYEQSHRGKIFEHYDDNREWTGAIRDSDLKAMKARPPVELIGNAGTVSVHHSRTVHGSRPNLSQFGRPVLVITYGAADAMPYTAPAYPSSHYGEIVRGVEPGYAHHEEMNIPMPPDWSHGYTSIFAHQEKE